MLSNELNMRDGEKELASLRGQLVAMENQNRSRGKIGKMKKEISTLSKKQFYAMADHLYKTNPSAKVLMDACLAKLASPNFTLKVTKTDFGMYTSYVKEISGTLRKNGWLYAHAETVSGQFMDFFEHLPVMFGFRVYPKAFEGTINFMGVINLHVKDHGYAFIGSQVPETLNGSIDKDGDVRIEVKKSSWELFSNKFAAKFIADPFKGNDQHRMQYIKLKTDIKAVINTARKELL